MPYRVTKTELCLLRTRFYYKEYQSTFNAQTNLVDENCYLSKELKVQIALELEMNTTRKEIADPFHIVQQITRALNQLRIKTMNKFQKTEPTKYRRLK